VSVVVAVGLVLDFGKSVSSIGVFNLLRADDDDFGAFDKDGDFPSGETFVGVLEILSRDVIADEAAF
jgi:hypothetical protein